MDLSPAIREAFDAEHFRQHGHQLIDQLADYLAQAGQGSDMPVLPPITPDAMLGRWSSHFPEAGGEDLNSLMTRVLADANHLHHPRYIGHQVSAPLPVAALCELVGALLNNGTAVYEMGPASTAMEQHVIRWMCDLVGYGPQAGGILTSGGSLGNLTALLAARQAKAGFDAWEAGNYGGPPLAVLVSEQTHYAVKRAVQIMGLGQGGMIPVPVDEGFKMTKAGLEAALARAHAEGRRVFAVVANACSTSTGRYDPLEVVADFCEAHDLWLHVDGAHGASALLSGAYRHLLAGVARADSVVWDAHKMMLVPALVTAVLYKDNNHGYEAFSHKAAYLFEKEARDEWFNIAHRTVECTKRMLSLKVYVPLMVYGTRLFEDYIDRTYGLTRQFAQVLVEAPDFEVAIPPESNIICFRMVPQGFGGDLDALQAQLRKAVLASGRFYIVQTRLPQGLFLRCTLMNPLTTREDLTALMAELRQLVPSPVP